MVVAKAEPRHITATEARVHLGQVIEEIRAGSAPIYVEKGGEAVLVMLSPAEYERLAGQDQDVWSRIEAIRREVAARTGGAPIGNVDDMINVGRE